MADQVAGQVLASNSVLNGTDGDSVVFRTNNRGDLRVVNALPELAEIVRLGNSWQVRLATGLAALTALPTTVAGLSLYNGAAAGSNICYIIDSFGSSEEVIDATQTDGTALYAMMNTVPATNPTATALTMRSLSGRLTYGGNAKAVTTLTVTNEGWFPHNPAGAQVAPVAAGANWKINEVNRPGLYIVPPGGMFNIQAVKAAAAAAAQHFFFMRWHEVILEYKS